MILPVGNAQLFVDQIFRIFDNDGNVRLVEESQKRKRHSEANLYVVPFARYQLMETMPLSMMKHLDEEVPPVFMILDTYDKDIKSLLPGTHLFCVYGDNWFQVIDSLKKS